MLRCCISRPREEHKHIIITEKECVSWAAREYFFFFFLYILAGLLARYIYITTTVTTTKLFFFLLYPRGKFFSFIFLGGGFFKQIKETQRECGKP